MAEDRLPEVVIVGRPNVGKSTLFNRILGRRQAIVGAEVGLTRDRHCAAAEWGGRHFLLNDTGGVEWESADELLRKIQDHALYAVEDAQLVLFLVDVRQGIVPIEARIVMELRRRGILMLLVVNKCDTEQIAAASASEFHELGVQPVFTIAAEHGDGVADLLDAIIARLPASDAEPDPLPEGTIKVAVVGRPNVGKSSLVNAMLGQERVVVSEVSGTTRDAIDTLMVRDERPYLLIDTAGIRRGGRREGFVEMVSVTIARRRMQRADVALLVVDATVGLTRQDVTIASEAGESGCAVIVVVNKWDLVTSQTGRADAWQRELRNRMGRIGFADVAFTSAKTGRAVDGLFARIDRVQRNRMRRVPTATLNALFERLEQRGAQGPPGSPQLKYLTQARVGPPSFVVFVSGGRRKLPDNFKRYLENRLRDEFDFSGTPVRVWIRRTKDRRQKATEGEL